MKKALISGITGQDGVYLTEFLLNKDYEVHGLVRRASTDNTNQLFQYLSKKKDYGRKLVLHKGDLTDSSSIFQIIKNVYPDEIYNLGAQSDVAVSFLQPEHTSNVNAYGPLRILEALRQLGLTQKTRFYQASTSELHGKVQEIPQNETTPFYPRNPYAVAKLYAYWITKNYREAYNMFACNGILFNHESPIRSESFVTRKITKSLVKIKLGTQKNLKIGNLESKRDWGHAKDYVEMMWAMLQKDEPKDYVVASGQQSSIREFIEITADILNLSLVWHGSGLDEIGVIDGREAIFVDKRYFRPSEVETLLGDSSLAKIELGWKPKITLKDLIKEMVDSDINEAKEKLK